MCIERDLNWAKEWLLARNNSDLDEENLNQIDRALEKQKEGTYGICDICGRPIGWDVRRAHPHATTHLECGLMHNLFPWSAYML